MSPASIIGARLGSMDARREQNTTTDVISADFCIILLTLNGG